MCLASGVARDAAAGGKTSKVTIETDPPGAKVYFNIKEDGEVCTTPCTVDAPIGETPIIVEAENRRPIIENLVVPRKTARPMRVSYKLRPAFGTLVVEAGDGAAGATILIDDQDQGTAPRRIEDILAGAHHVVLQKGGKKLYDAFVEVEIGREASVTPSAVAPEPPPARPAGEVPTVAASREPDGGPRRGPALSVRAVTDVGFRQFKFHRPDAAPVMQNNDSEGGMVMTGAAVEVWPTTLFHLGVLPGLALYGRFEIGVNPQPVRLVGMSGRVTDTTLSTSWRSFELSARHRWTIGSAAAVEVGGGYAVDRYQFKSDDPFQGPHDRAVVPDAIYKAVRIGARGSLRVGPLEPYLALENRIVLSVGVLDSRFGLGASAVGYRGALGAVLHLGRFDVRAEGRITLYSWTFRPDSTDPDQADSGSDMIEQIGLSVGYTY